MPPSIFYTTPIPKQGPDRPLSSLIWAFFWDGGGIEEGTLEVYDTWTHMGRSVPLMSNGFQGIWRTSP